METAEQRGHHDLIAWQKAMDLVTAIYSTTQKFPREELYGLTGQLRRAAVSVPGNLAEGYGRNSKNEFHYFIGLARGSLAEVETQVEIAMNLGYLDPEAYSRLFSRIDEVGRMLTGLRSWSAKVLPSS